jgi:hypothetical protein
MAIPHQKALLGAVGFLVGTGGAGMAWAYPEWRELGLVLVAIAFIPLIWVCVMILRGGQTVEVKGGTKQMSKRMGDTYNVTNTGSGTAIARAETVNIHTEDKSLKKQFRDLLTLVDGRILLAIDQGQLRLKIRMTTAQLSRFQDLCATPGSRALIENASVVGRHLNSLINNGSLGPTTAEAEQATLEITFTSAMKR